MLRVKRHDGRSGADFQATTAAGNEVTVTADHSHIIPLDVEEHDERTRILAATGPLDLMDRLRSAAERALLLNSSTRT